MSRRPDPVNTNKGKEEDSGKPQARPKRVYRFSINNEPTSPTSPQIQKNPHNRNSSKEPTDDSGEPKAPPNLKEFALELQQEGERTAILLNDRFNSVKAKIKEKPDALENPQKMQHLEKLYDLVTGASYQMAKANHILQPSGNEKPTKPLKASEDAESLISSLNFALSRFQTTCRDLAGNFLIAAQQGAGGSPVSMKQAFGKPKDPVPKAHVALADKLAGNSAEESLKHAGLDAKMIMTLPSHFELAMATIGFLLQSFAQITSMKAATGILLAGLRWKRKAAKKMAAKPKQVGDVTMAEQT